MLSDLDKLLMDQSELKKLGLKPYIGNQMAANYIKGLNGQYARRLQKGIQMATSSSSDQLTDIIQSLLADRRKKNCPTNIEIPHEETSRRALIMALWTSRPVHLGRTGAWELKSKQCYGDQYYTPVLGEISSPRSHITNKDDLPCYQPTSEDVERILEVIDPNDDGVAEDKLRDQIELDAKKTGKDLCSDWWKNLQTANESTENLG